MCGRYVSPEQAAIERFWHVGRHNNSNPFQRRFNVAPTTVVPIILRGDGLQEGLPLELIGARWGLIPHWWKKDTLPTLTFNARSEEAAQKPMWRDALRTHRCLMPACGWYEWCESEPVHTAAGRKVNQPYYIRSPRSDVMAIAGLWSSAGPVVSCALMTRAAAPCIAAIHHRMPVILKPEHYESWLSPETLDLKAIIDDAQQDFEGYRVSTQVNNTRNDFPELLNATS